MAIEGKGAVEMFLNRAEAFDMAIEWEGDGEMVTGGGMVRWSVKGKSG